MLESKPSKMKATKKTARVHTMKESGKASKQVAKTIITKEAGKQACKSNIGSKRKQEIKQARKQECMHTRKLQQCL